MRANDPGHHKGALGWLCTCMLGAVFCSTGTPLLSSLLSHVKGTAWYDSFVLVLLVLRYGSHLFRWGANSRSRAPGGLAGATQGNDVLKEA